MWEGTCILGSAEHTEVVQQLFPSFIPAVGTVPEGLMLPGTKALGDAQLCDVGPAYSHCVICVDCVGNTSGEISTFWTLT